MMLARPLHYVIKIGNRKASYDFYVKKLGMKILRHEEFEEGCKAECNGPYNGRWSKTMVGYGDEAEYFVVEMTYNYEIGSYRMGNDFKALYIDNSGLFARLCAEGAPSNEEGRFVRMRSPDGHDVFVGNEPRKDDGQPRVVRLALRVASMPEAAKYWSDHLGMTVLERKEDSLRLGYGDQTAGWSLELLAAPDALIDRASAYGRTAFACATEALAPLEAKMKAAGYALLKPLVELDTPGKATVHVVILADPNGHEICFVGDEAFRELSAVDPEGEAKLLKAIQEDTSDQWFGEKGKKSV